MKQKALNAGRNTIQFLAIGFAFLVMIIAAFIYFPNHLSDIPFNKDQWQTFEDVKLDGGLRDRMLNNLLESHVLTGLHYQQLTDLLGEPDIKEFGRIDDEKSVSYRIKATYDVIDPDYTKDLVFILDKDSVVNHFIIKEWHRSDEN